MIKGSKMTPEQRARISSAKKGRPNGRLGVRHTPETRALISQRVRERALRGEACHSYKDGRVAERRGQRFSQEYKRWRYDVFTRDGFTCQQCGDDRGGNLVAHHIEGFAENELKRFDVDNGVTWCRPCHNRHHKEHGYG